MRWVRERGRFVIAAERAGLTWFVGVWKYLAPPVAVAGLAGLGGWLAGRVPLWLIAVYAVAFVVLLFGEGAFKLWREADAQARETSVVSLADELGEFHAEGIELLGLIPRTHDDDADQLDPWRERADEWVTRVADVLSAKAPRWRSVLLASPGGVRFSGHPYSAYNALCADIRDRLKQLQTIMEQV